MPSVEVTVQNTGDGYQVSPMGQSVYSQLPAPLAGGPKTPYLPNIATAKLIENGLPDDTYAQSLDPANGGLCVKPSSGPTPNGTTDPGQLEGQGQAPSQSQSQTPGQGQGQAHSGNCPGM